MQHRRNCIKFAFIKQGTGSEVVRKQGMVNFMWANGLLPSYNQYEASLKSEIYMLFGKLTSKFLVLSLMVFNVIGLVSSVGTVLFGFLF